MKKFIFFILILILISSSAYALEIKSFVDKTNISLNESINLSVKIVDESVDDVDISSIKDFRVISQGTSSSVKIVNSSISKETIYNYVLFPLKKGNLIIPSLNVLQGKNRYKTKPINIDVSDKPIKTTDNLDNIFIRAKVLNNTPYVGEQLVYIVSLYSRVRFSNARLQQPNFSGFTAKKIENNRQFNTVLQGKEFNVTEVRYILIPINKGEVTINPAMLSCDLIVQQRSRPGFGSFDSFFSDSFFHNTKKKMLQTDPVNINVKELPDYNDNQVRFSGLVGKNINIHVDIDKDHIAEGDSATLSIAVKGFGNIMDTELPQLDLPDSFKVYDDNPQEDIQIGDSGYYGKKIFHKALVPIKAGEYKISAINITYFDTNQKQYKKVKSDPISVFVAHSNDQEKTSLYSAKSPESLPALKKKQVEFTGHDILKLKEELNSIDHKGPISLVMFLSLILLPWGFFIIFYFLLHFSRKNKDSSIILMDKANIFLKKASYPDISEHIFLSYLYKAIIAAIYSKQPNNSGINGESLTGIEAEKILSASNYSDTMIKQVVDILSAIESAKYSGSQITEEFRNTLLSDLKDVIGRLFK